MTSTVRVELPAGLCLLAGIPREVPIRLEGTITLRTILDALETDHPVLLGTIRDRNTGRRRPFIRFFACQQDLSHQPPDDPVPEPVAQGTEALLVVGAIAGG